MWSKVKIQKVVNPEQKAFKGMVMPSYILWREQRPHNSLLEFILCEDDINFETPTT